MGITIHVFWIVVGWFVYYKLYFNTPTSTNRNYCVRRHMFFASTNPIEQDNLSKDDAHKLCEKLNKDERATGDGMYTHYEVHLTSE